MDDLIKFNKERWEALAKANIVFSRPALNLDESSAREMLDPYGMLEKMVGNLAGKQVLCLASAGGQQSAAFALLGARVTVYDLSETQLERDQQAAAHYGFAPQTIETIQGDMRDLRRFDDYSFDIVWQPPSINFVPDARQVFAEVARVIRRGGLYRMDCNNPFVMGMDERGWNGTGYSMSQPYIDGAEVTPADPRWEVWNEHGNCIRVLGPREFRHSLGTIINGLVENGFLIMGLWEELSKDPDAVPGSWDHFMLVAPPSLSFWCTSGKTRLEFESELSITSES